MLTFATVNWRNYEGRGVEYANILFDGVRRNLREGTPGRFVVFTDNVSEPGYNPEIELRQLPEGLDGWYNKLSLFRDGAFDYGDRVVYFDLDTVITGSLDDIAKYDGYFAILRDVYRPDGLQSSVMAWEHGEYDYVWEGFKAFRYPKLANGDQEWIEQSIESPAILQKLFPGKFASYKCDAQYGIPPNSSVVFFHGWPKPSDFAQDGWARWEKGYA